MCLRIVAASVRVRALVVIQAPIHVQAYSFEHANTDSMPLVLTCERVYTFACTYAHLNTYYSTVTGNSPKVSILNRAASDDTSHGKDLARWHAMIMHMELCVTRNTITRNSGIFSILYHEW